MARRRKRGLAISDDSFSLTSMIDIIFLLLIYFMYLPIQQEADLTVMLPVQVPPEVAPKVLPSEQKIVIRPNGDIILNGSRIAGKGEIKLDGLATTLARLKKMADDAGAPTIVTIIPDGDSQHQSSMSILDACAQAKIKQVSFSDSI
ncbi:MAG: biopolymer transporter ExbD [Opitutales bacterium]|nr:biopolymer transporter ExbD [Opitutales bacterium]